MGQICKQTLQLVQFSKSIGTQSALMLFFPCRMDASNRQDSTQSASPWTPWGSWRVPSGPDPLEAVTSRLFQPILCLHVALARTMVEHADLPLLMKNHLPLQC